MRDPNKIYDLVVELMIISDQYIKYIVPFFEEDRRDTLFILLYDIRLYGFKVLESLETMYEVTDDILLWTNTLKDLWLDVKVIIGYPKDKSPKEGDENE